MNKEPPIKSKEEILDFWYETGMHWKASNRYNVLKAMEDYKNQFTTPIQSGEERLLAEIERLKGLIEWLWLQHNPHSNFFGHTDGEKIKQQKRYLQKFQTENSLLSSEQNVNK